MTRTLAAALAALCLAAPAGAVVVTESALSGGGFSADWRAPTAIAPGATRIEGTGRAGDPDFLRLSLAPGAQTLSFTFIAPAVVDPRYAAGGELLWSEAPFAWSAWDGTRGGAFGLNRGRREVSLDLDLPDAFAGELTLALHFTYGQLAWVLDLPAAPAPGGTELAPAPELDPDPTDPVFPRDENATAAAAVPGPAAGLLLLTALGALVAGRRRRRAARA